MVELTRKWKFSLIKVYLVGGLCCAILFSIEREGIMKIFYTIGLAVVLAATVLLSAMAQAPAKKQEKAKKKGKENRVFDIYSKAVLVSKSPIEEGQPIIVSITISNGMEQAISFHYYDTQVNSDNSESLYNRLANVFRDDESVSIYSGPEIKGKQVLKVVKLNPGETITYKLDIVKWTLTDKWRPGKYKASIWRDNISVEGDDFTLLSTLSNPVEFTIKKK